MAELGIDIAKNKFQAALLKNGKYKSKSFSNNAPGFIALLTWLQQRESGEVHACLEATGNYGDSLAKFLFENGYTVSVVNPSRIKAFGESELLRNKNDKIDAQLIARFCQKINRQYGSQTLPKSSTYVCSAGAEMSLSRCGPRK